MGTLFVVATPIGNLEDITLRALRVLREVGTVAAEDTRHTRRLLTHFGIGTPLVAFHAHSGPARLEHVLRLLATGDVALVTDAGTPAVSDPGQALVDAALAAGHVVSPIPGPSALTAAVSASGLVPGPFVFAGFLPRKPGERRRQLAALAATGLPLVVYEAGNRAASTLADLAEATGGRQAALCRELTKVHEEIRRAALPDLATSAAASEPRGELVIVVAGGKPAAEPWSDDRVAALVAELRATGLSRSATAKEVAARAGVDRSEAYRLAGLPVE